MSVYGNMIKENSNKSLENIYNDMNVMCLEIHNYSTFMDEFILESDIKILNEGFFEVIGKAFTWIKEKIKSLIESVGKFISNLFTKKSGCKKDDKLGEEVVKNPKDIKIKPKSNNNKESKSNNKEPKSEYMKRRTIENPGTHKYRDNLGDLDSENKHERDMYYHTKNIKATRYNQNLQRRESMNRTDLRNQSSYKESQDIFQKKIYRKIKIGNIIDPKELDEAIDRMYYNIEYLKESYDKSIINKIYTNNISRGEEKSMSRSITRFRGEYSMHEKIEQTYFDFINYPKDLQKRILTKSADYTDKINKCMKDLKKQLEDTLKQLEEIDKKVKSLKYEDPEDKEHYLDFIKDLIKDTKESFKFISEGNKVLMDGYIHIKKQQIKIIKVFNYNYIKY